jgi:hypothetical protein
MPVDESDLAFTDFGGANSGAKRLYPAPTSSDGKQLRIAGIDASIWHLRVSLVNS